MFSLAIDKRLRVARMITAIAAAAVVSTVSGTATARADALPSHGSANAYCVADGLGDYYIQGVMPQMDVQDAALGWIAGDGSFSFGSDEYVYYRIWVGWVDQSGQMQWAAGNWLASLNGFPNSQGYGEWSLLDGQWQYLQPGVSFPNIVSGVTITPGVNYVVWGQYYWAAVGNAPGINQFEEAGPLNCPA